VKADSTSVTRRNLYGWTALLYAAYLGHEPAVAFLLDKGAKADECNDKGQTALMLAAACGNLKVGIFGNLLTLVVSQLTHNGM
jgi:ankyrin repeat protein